jgi:hypothetical protein
MSNCVSSTGSCQLPFASTSTGSNQDAATAALQSSSFTPPIVYGGGLPTPATDSFGGSCMAAPNLPFLQGTQTIPGCAMPVSTSADPILSPKPAPASTQAPASQLSGNTPSEAVQGLQSLQHMNQLWRAIENGILDAQGAERTGNTLLRATFPAWRDLFVNNFPKVNTWVTAHGGIDAGNLAGEFGRTLAVDGDPNEAISTVNKSVLDKFKSWGGAANTEFGHHFTAASLIFGGINTAISTRSFIHTMADPNSTLFAKVANGVHVGTSALGLIPTPWTMGISFAGDLGMMGLESMGLLKDKTPAPPPAKAA